MKKIVVLLVTGARLNFDIKDEEVEAFQKNVIEGIKGISSGPDDRFCWINIDHIVQIVVLDVEEFEEAQPKAQPRTVSNDSEEKDKPSG